MKQTKKNILLIAGVIGSILGIAYLIPAFIKEIYWLAVVGTVLIIGGLVFIAIAFGD